MRLPTAYIRETDEAEMVMIEPFQYANRKIIEFPGLHQWKLEVQSQRKAKRE